MNFFRPPLTSFIKTLADPQLESEQFMIGNESITSKKDVIRQLQEQILHFKEAHHFTQSEMDVIRQFELLLESKHKRRDIHFQSQTTDMTRKKKSEVFRMKRAKRRTIIKVYAKKLNAARNRFRILGQFISNEEIHIIEETFGSHVFSDNRNFSLKIGIALKNKFGYEYYDKSQVIKEIKRLKKQQDQILSHQIIKIMNELLNYALAKCFQENILNVVKVKTRAHKPLLTSGSQVIDLPQKNRSNFMSKKSHPSCDLQIDTELEYSHSKIRQKSINDVQLPHIQLDAIHRNFFDNQNINESDCPTTKRYDRYRSFSTKASKNQRKGFLGLEINNQQITLNYKKLLSKLNAEFTKFQLTLYLTQYIGSLDYVSKLLQLLNCPSKITLPSFKQLIYQIQDMQQIEIQSCIFQTFDLDCKGFISSSDLFKMFTSNGAIQKDVDFIYKNVPIENEREKKLKRIYLCEFKEKPRPMLITTMKNSPRNKYKIKQFQGNIINFEMFCKIYNKEIPEIFKEFIRLMFYNYI
ncbi:unnamed protein product (macronuclear) [Paramecium tetraurelia]|uniref:EF-hand domain-containing protein n=1 Tax=Paramecium tetraurelia TaxID=5888 RepID=A0CCQ7_PARTE|nr:uncharacterized protein GSPATT00037359001 [Paramecium tetraurelia]CAK68574.1 unnamed protein product [Paramecium tetraurelia]|eukprot:XP_001435971.1 hypothetical protein (macronuclear) [Paramecium tetraurelia strain d4-2]